MRRSRSRGWLGRRVEAPGAPDLDRVRDVLEELSSSIEGVTHLFAVGPRSEELGRYGDAPLPEKKLALTMAATLGSAVEATPTGSAQCSLVIANGPTILFFLVDGITIVLIGPPQWNLALINRQIDSHMASIGMG